MRRKAPGPPVSQRSRGSLNLQTARYTMSSRTAVTAVTYGCDVIRCLPCSDLSKEDEGSTRRISRFADSLCVDMCCTCKYAWHMSKMIQVRNVPDTLHRRLKSRAALA